MIRRSIAAVKRDLASVRVKGSFARNALYTFGDAAVNILSQVILTPIVAGIYGPAAYGIYGLFSSITSNLVGIGGLGYPAAFVLPKDDRTFLALARIAWLSLLALVALTLPIFLFPSVLYRLVPSWAVMGDWCMLIPWTTLVICSSQMLANWTMRAKEFPLMAKIGSATNISMRLVNLVVGLLTKGAVWGLVFGEVMIRTLASIAYALGLRKHGLAKLFREEERAPLKPVALEYRDYPLYIFPARWLNLFALQLPIFGLSVLGDTSVVGRFTLAGSLLLMPLRLFGYSLSSVFIRKAADHGTDDPAALGELVRRMYIRLRAIGLLPFISLIFFGDLVFNAVLGGKWSMAGAYCGVMGPFYLFRLLSEPIATVYSAQRRERSLFRFNIALFLLNAAAVGTGTYLLSNALAIVVLFAAVNALAYMYQSAAILARTGLPWQRMTATTLAAGALVAILMSMLRFLIFGSWFPALT